jgi:TatD DNase family protein
MNEPGFVRHVAEYIADLKGVPLVQVAQQTTDNFFNLFKIVRD